MRRNIDDLEGELGRSGCSLSETTALDRGEMLAQRVDLRDGGSRGNERLMEGDGVRERDFRIEREIEECAAAAADEIDDERLFRCASQHAESAACCPERVLIRQR